MKGKILGIHHVTAICGDAQTNLDFYTQVLGLRLVKKTVNFDDPTAYHLYFGDTAGTPGTLLTFFPYPDGRSAQPGIGGALGFAFAIPESAAEYWKQRLTQHNLRFEEKGGEIEFKDPDGIQVQLVPTRWQRGEAYGDSTVPTEFQIRSILRVTIPARDATKTENLLSQHFQAVKQGEDWVMEDGSRIRIHADEAMPFGHGGHGSIHHIAFRTPNDAEQEAWLEFLQTSGYRVSPVMDRNYFHSIYFREPNNTLFEIATDGPGMAIDEDAAHLGEALRLPAQYESHRELIERSLPPLRIGAPAKR
ncbi:MAG: VOC family protein [Armatimonadetes bacterium]|nr:VOC family protein [Armatimonadota bacterium]